MTRKRRKYQELPAYDIHTRIREIERQVTKLEKGIEYLNLRMARTDDPEWDQNEEEWRLFKRANKRLIKELRATQTELRQELTQRAIQVARKKGASLEGPLTNLEKQVTAAVEGLRKVLVTA